MKRSIVFLALLTATGLSFAQEDINERIKDIDNEIIQIESLIKTEDRPQAYETFLSELKLERERYVRLVNKRPEVSQSLATDPTVSKTIPKAVAKKADKLAEIQDEAVPLTKRYDIILRELSSTRDILIKLSKYAETSAATKKFIAQEEERLAELEKIKIDYEIKFSEMEEAEFAQVKQSGLRVGAMLDFYYQYDFNRADNKSNIPNRNYNNRSNDFTVSLMELNVYKSYKNLDFYADLDFGQFAEQNSPHNSDSATHHIGQAFMRYKLPELDGVTVTAGKFYSHVGLEVAKAIDNRNYSRPYSFTLGIPFWHEGVSIYKSGLGPFGVGLYYYDRTDVALENNTGKAYGSQISYIDGPVTSYLNFISGAETEDEGNMRTIYEWNIVYALKPTLNFAFDVTSGSEKNATADGKDTRWLGLVGYVDYKATNRDSICLRVENFKDLTSDGAISNKFVIPGNTNNPPIQGGPNIMSYTLTNRYNLKNGSEIRGEWRSDHADKKIYPKKGGSFSEHQDTLTLAWLYSI